MFFVHIYKALFIAKLQVLTFQMKTPITLSNIHSQDLLDG